MATNKFALGKDSWFGTTLLLERVTELTTITTSDPTKALQFDSEEQAINFAKTHNIQLYDANSKDPTENTVVHFTVFII